MKLLDQYGPYKVYALVSRGRSGYQVRKGRNVLSRWVLFHSAQTDADARNKADWDALSSFLATQTKDR